MRKIRYKGSVNLKDDYTFPVSWLNTHMLITGVYGIGERELLQKITWNVANSHPEIGILYLSQFSEQMKYRYPWDYYHDTKDFRLSIPYFHGSAQDAQNVKNCVAAFSGPFGFSDYFQERLSDFVQTIELPDCLSDLFGSFKEYVLETKFLSTEEYYTLSALGEAFRIGRHDKFFKLNTGKIDWVEMLFKGGKIFVDVSGFGYSVLFSALILQTLRCNLPPKTENSAIPKILIISEQAAINVFRRRLNNRLSEKPFNQFMGGLLRDFESKGVSLIIEEERPYSLAQNVYELTKLKVFFRLWYPATEGLLLTEEEVKIIRDLPNQEALIYSSG